MLSECSNDSSDPRCVQLTSEVGTRNYIIFSATTVIGLLLMPWAAMLIWYPLMNSRFRIPKILSRNCESCDVQWFSECSNDSSDPQGIQLTSEVGTWNYILHTFSIYITGKKTWLAVSVFVSWCIFTFIKRFNKQTCMYVCFFFCFFFTLSDLFTLFTVDAVSSHFDSTSLAELKDTWGSEQEFRVEGCSVNAQLIPQPHGAFSLPRKWELGIE